MRTMSALGLNDRTTKAHNDTGVRCHEKRSRYRLLFEIPTVGVNASLGMTIHLCLHDPTKIREQRKKELSHFDEFAKCDSPRFF